MNCLMVEKLYISYYFAELREKLMVAYETIPKWLYKYIVVHILPGSTHNSFLGPWGPPFVVPSGMTMICFTNLSAEPWRFSPKKCVFSVRRKELGYIFNKSQGTLQHENHAKIQATKERLHSPVLRFSTFENFQHIKKNSGQSTDNPYVCNATQQMETFVTNSLSSWWLT